MLLSVANKEPPLLFSDCTPPFLWLHIRQGSKSKNCHKLQCMLSCGHTLQKIFRIVICSKLTVCSLLALQLDRLLQKDRLSQILHDLPYLKELKQASHVVGRRINRRMLSASQCALEKLQGSVSLGCSAPWQAVLKSSTSPWGGKKGNKWL